MDDTSITEAEAADSGRPQLPRGKIVGAVSNAVLILRHLSENARPMGVSHIADATKLNTSTCFNILRTLVMHDFVQFDPRSKTYSLSLGIMDIARGATSLRGDIGSVRPLMEDIANTHSVTVTVWQIVSENRKVLTLSAMNRSAVRIQMSIGQRLPILLGATGRCFAAFGDYKPSELKKMFKEVRFRRPLEFEEFLDQVEQTRQRGYAVDQGYFATGILSFSVPVLDSNNMAIAAITATMFDGQFDGEAAVERIYPDLTRLGVQLSRIMTNSADL